MKRILLFMFTFFPGGEICAQQSVVDSLLNEVAKAKEDTNKVKLYSALAKETGAGDPQTGIHYSILGAALSKKINFDKGTANSYNTIGRLLAGIGKYDSAISKYDTAIYYAMKSENANVISLCYIGRANAYIFFNNQLEKAQADCMAAIPYAEKSQNKDRQARIKMTMGNIFYYQFQYEKAKSYYENSIKLFGEINNREMVATCYMNIAGCLKEHGLDIKDNHMVEEAITYHNKAEKILDSLGYTERLINVYSNRGFAYMQLNKLYEARIDLEKARTLSVQIGDVEMYASNTQLLAELFMAEENYQEALNYLLPVIDSTKKYGLVDDQADVTRSLSKLYELTGDSKTALAYLKEFYTLKDTLLNRMQNEQLLQLQAQYEADKKNEQIQLLSKDKEIQEQQLARQKLIAVLIFSAAVALLAVGFLFFYRYRKGKQIQELSLRNKIAADLHDDIGSTLSSIRMYSEMVKTQLQDSATASQMLDKISSNARESVESMSDIVWMINPKNDLFSNLINRMEQYASEMCSGKNINLDFEKKSGAEGVRIPMESRKNIYLIFKEAVNNAVKYSGANHLKVSLEQTDHHIKMEVADNGNGFDVSTIRKGNGLENMLQRAKAIDGEVKIDSTFNAGTSIIFSSAIP